MIKHFFSLFIALATLPGISFASGYNIQVKIHHAENQQVFLGYHYGKKLYVKDTLQLDDKGQGAFTGEENLKRGLYLVYLPNQKYFDIIVDGDQDFTVINDTTDFVDNIEIKNSAQNKAFYEYQQFLKSMQQEAKNLREQKKAYKEAGETEKVKAIDKQFKQVNEMVNAKMDDIVEKYDDALLAKLLLASKEMEIPDPPRDEEGNITDSLFQYRYYKEHYFDKLDLTDDRLLRTPFIETKINQYFSTLPQVPDTLIPEAERIIEMAREDKDVYQFVLSFLFNHFLKSNIMGMDKVYAYIGEKYYLGGQAPWADSTFLAKLEERIQKIKPNLIGNKAPNLKMLSNMGGYVSLHEVEAKITVLAFWEPNCGHCSKVIPKLEEIYEEYQDKGLEVYAVYTQNKKEEWVEFINEHALTFINVYDPYYTSNFRNLYDIYSTPTIYLLDEDKNILAKRIAADDMKKFLKHELEE